MVLADLGAGSGKFTFKWFDDMHDPLQEAGVRFLAIGVLTSEAFIIETRWSFVQYQAQLRSARRVLLGEHREGGTRYPASVAD
jgi:hypothetical protein